MLKKILSLTVLFVGLIAVADNNKIEADNYNLDLSQNIKIELKDSDGKITPFLSWINIETAGRDWTFIYRTDNIESSFVKKTPEYTEYTLRYNFKGKKADLIQVTGTLKAYNDWISIKFTGKHQGDLENYIRRRIVFGHPAGEMSMYTPTLQTGYPDQKQGLRLDMKPDYMLHHTDHVNHSNITPIWQKQADGTYSLDFEIALVPYFDTPPMFSKLSENNLEAKFSFTRPCSIILDRDIPQANLFLINREQKLLKTNAEIVIKDHLNNIISNLNLKIEAPKDRIIQQEIALPVSNLYGYFEMDLKIKDKIVATHSFCRLPPTERAHKNGSIFGGIIYPWNKKRVEQLDLMSWIGMNVIRNFYQIVEPGIQVPKKEQNKTYSVKDTELLFHEYKNREIESIPYTTSIFDFPAGTFRVTEGQNEANARRLPVDFAEQSKIEYVKAKHHDPNIMVGTTGTAGVDIHWFEEMQDSEIWDYSDAIFVHLHSFPRAPEVNNTMTRNFWLHDRVTLVKGLLNKYGDKPVFDSENGYLTIYPDRRVENYNMLSVSESNIAAAFMVRCYLQSMAYGLKNKMWFTIDTYGGFGITEYDQPRPSYPAYAAMTKILDGAEYVGELLSPGLISSVLDQDTEFSRSWFGQATPGLEKELLTADQNTALNEKDENLKPYLYIRAFKNPEQKPIIVAWATLKRQDLIKKPIDTPAWAGLEPGKSLLWNGFPIEEEPEPIPVRIDTGVEEVEIYDIMGNSRKVKTDNGSLTLQLDDYPKFIVGASPKLLTEAEQFSLNLFPSEFKPNSNWKNLIQVILPSTKKHPPRKSVFDKLNLSDTINSGQETSFYVRLTNLSEEQETGKVSLDIPSGWQCTPESVSFTIDSGKEQEIVAEFKVVPNKTTEKVKITSIVTSDTQGKIANSTMNVAVK